MSVQVHKIKDFIILIEDFEVSETVSKTVTMDQEMVGFVFYVSGNLSVDVQLNNKKSSYIKKTGHTSSFFYSPEDTLINHQISHKVPLRKVSIFIAPENLNILLKKDEKIAKSDFNKILNPDAPFVEGIDLLMIPNMHSATQEMLNNQYTGFTKDLLLESHALGLISHYFNRITSISTLSNKVISSDVEKLHFAREILLKELDNPPSLTELSKLTELNSFKLKTGFKALFGMPVYKYLQDQRLIKSFKLIESGEMNVQQASYFVGYESLSSFSNAFTKKYKFRPSQIKK